MCDIMMKSLQGHEINCWLFQLYCMKKCVEQKIEERVCTESPIN